MAHLYPYPQYFVKSLAGCGIVRRGNTIILALLQLNIPGTQKAPRVMRLISFLGGAPTMSSSLPSVLLKVG